MYQKTVWVDHETVVSAENMNKIEGELARLGETMEQKTPWSNAVVLTQEEYDAIKVKDFKTLYLIAAG